MVAEKNIPEIRFKGFEGEWEEHKLINVAGYRNGKAHENEISEKGEFVVVNSKFVSTNGEIKKFSAKQIEPLYKNEIAFVLSDVPNGRAIARTFLVDVDNKFTLNQRIAGITPLENTDSYYLHILMNRHKYFLQFDDGAKQTNLSKADVEEFSEFYPEKPEQNKIGTYFQNLDSLISLKQRKYDKLLTVKKAMLEKMFPKEGADVPEIRFKGFEGKWEERKISDITSFHKQGYYTTEKYDESKKYYLLRGTDLSSNKLEIKDTPKINSNIKDFQLFKVQKGDFLIVRSGTVGTYGIVNDDIQAIFGSYLICFRFYKEIVLNEFFGFFYQTNLFKRQLRQIIQQSANTNINAENIKSVAIYIPCIHEQEKIGMYFCYLDTLIAQHQKQLEKLKNLKKACLEKMFV